MGFSARMLIIYGFLLFVVITGFSSCSVSSCSQQDGTRQPASTQKQNTTSNTTNTQSVPRAKPIIRHNKQANNAKPFIGKHTGKRIFEARAENITPQNYPEVIESFVFPNADLKDVINTMNTDLNINIIMDPSIANKKISIISHSPITVAEAYQAFLSALSVHNLTVIPSGSFVKVVSKEKALKSNIEVNTRKKALKTDQFLTHIIKLKHITAESLERKIKPFIDSKAVQSMIFYEPSNMVIISDYGLNIQKFRKIITTLDVPNKETQFKVIPIKHAQADALSQIISNLLSGANQYSSSYSSYRRSKSRSFKVQKSGINIQSLFHDDRTNSIIVMGNTLGIKKVENLVSELDYYKDPALAGGIFVYKVKHGTAKDLASTLNEVIGNSSTASSKSRRPSKIGLLQSKYSSGRFGRSRMGSLHSVDTARAFKDVRIIAEENTNSLLIVSNKYNYETILGILNKVDISRNQVFIKTIIMELNTDKNRDWKIANYWFPKDGKGASRMGYGLNSLQDLTSFAGATLTFPLSLILPKSLQNRRSVEGITEIDPFYLGMSQSPNTTSETDNKSDTNSKTNAIPIPTLSSFVQFLQKNVGANILSTPQVMALDHQEAIVTINENIPVVGTLLTNNNNSNQTGTNINYKDVETALKITPHINPDVSSVRLQIEQKIDSIIKGANVPKQVQNAAVSIKKRTIKTNIALKDKETAVLGGLVKESNTNNESKIPILGDLPFVGWLFKNSETHRKKSNLIVFITPQIIRSADEHQAILKSKLNERMDFIHRFIGDKDPYESTTKSMTHANKNNTHKSSISNDTTNKKDKADQTDQWDTPSDEKSDEALNDDSDEALNDDDDEIIDETNGEANDETNDEANIEINNATNDETNDATNNETSSFDIPEDQVFPTPHTTHSTTN